MKITILQADKSGNDVFDKDYSVAVVRDNTYFFGCNLSQRIKDKILHEFRERQLGSFDKLRLKLRVHTALIILIVLRAVPVTNVKLELQVCNDFDGHFQEIKQMLFDNLHKTYPWLDLNDIKMTRFSKPSIIDDVAKKLFNKDFSGIDVVNVSFEDMVKIVRKK